MPVVLITRSPLKAREFTAALESALPDGQVLYAPVLEAVQLEPEEWGETALALIRGEFSWVTFTSVNGVTAFKRLAQQLGQSAASLLGAARLAAVGQVTARALTELGLVLDFVPENQCAAGMLDQWPLEEEEESPTDQTLLLVQGEAASPTLEEGLSDFGYTTVPLPVYRMQPFPAEKPLLARQEEDSLSLETATAREALTGVDVLVATSPMILATLAKGLEGPLPPTVTIGPSTEKAARELGAGRPSVIRAASSPAPADLAAAVTDLLLPSTALSKE